MLRFRLIDALLNIREQQEDGQLLLGSFSIEQGMLAIRNRKATYLVAVDGSGSPVGAMGFQADRASGLARAVELIGCDPRVLGFLCREFVLQTDCSILEVTVSVRAVNVQRTFWKLGFRPAAYAPAVAFDGRWRRDGLRMVRIQQWRDINPQATRLTDQAQELTALAQQTFLRES